MSDLEQTVKNCSAEIQIAIARVLAPYRLSIASVPDKHNIPGSFFGEREAGLIADTLYLRHDTPVHSALHEACHYICMSPARRQALDTDAEGDYAEENGVCYLQIVLADLISDMGQNRMLKDMDAWGYSFRLGSAKAWFEQDAEDALAWLQQYHIIDQHHHVTFRLRGDS